MDDRVALRAWYAPRRTAYPWRSDRPDPYLVLVSEVMLQQTQASRVAPAYRRFVRSFPTIRRLAAASPRDVLGMWAGLGYNRRAVAIREAARAVVRDHRGRVPSDPAVLRGLPGIGPYTAAAVASIAYGAPLPALDVNVRRVVARARLGRNAAEAGGPAVASAAEAWLERNDPGAWNQALMDLGREVCRPAPRCSICPLAGGCRYRRGERASESRTPGGRRQEPFAGSLREVRGLVVRALLDRPVTTLAGLAGRTGAPSPRVAEAVRALARDAVVSAGPAALAGRPSGRVSLGRRASNDG
jgi:A/G-specific adenine glycosylase